jgi:hypothetical protein
MRNIAYRSRVIYSVENTPVKFQDIPARAYMWSDTMISDVPFIHRKNPDSTHDSICTTCFLTVARGLEETALLDGEQSHECTRAIQVECGPEQLQQAS